MAFDCDTVCFSSGAVIHLVFFRIGINTEFGADEQAKAVRWIDLDDEFRRGVFVYLEYDIADFYEFFSALARKRLSDGECLCLFHPLICRMILEQDLVVGFAEIYDLGCGITLVIFHIY